LLLVAAAQAVTLVSAATAQASAAAVEQAQAAQAAAVPSQTHQHLGLEGEAAASAFLVRVQTGQAAFSTARILERFKAAQALEALDNFTVRAEARLLLMQAAAQFASFGLEQAVRSRARTRGIFNA